MAQLTTLLLTRPHAASQRFARQVVDQLGEIRIETSPLIDIDFLDLNEEPNAQTIVFTSRNGVDAWSRACFTTRASCFCVGEATADAARAIGLYCDLACRAALDGMSAQLGAAGVDLGAMEEAPVEEALSTEAEAAPADAAVVEAAVEAPAEAAEAPASS